MIGQLLLINKRIIMYLQKTVIGKGMISHMKTNRKTAAALSYDKLKDSSPKMTALGKGTIAEEIIQKASSNDIPVLEDPSLVALLSELNINETIPEEL